MVASQPIGGLTDRRPTRYGRRLAAIALCGSTDRNRSVLLLTLIERAAGAIDITSKLLHPRRCIRRVALVRTTLCTTQRCIGCTTLYLNMFPVFDHAG